MAEGPGVSETKDTSSTVTDGGVPHRDSIDAGVPMGVSAGSGGTGGTSVPGMGQTVEMGLVDRYYVYSPGEVWVPVLQ